MCLLILIIYVWADVVLLNNIRLGYTCGFACDLMEICVVYTYEYVFYIAYKGNWKSRIKTLRSPLRQFRCQLSEEFLIHCVCNSRI